MIDIRTMYTWCLTIINVSQSDDIALVYYKDCADTYEDACNAVTAKIFKECRNGVYAVREVTIYEEEVL